MRGARCAGGSWRRSAVAARRLEDLARQGCGEETLLRLPPGSEGGGYVLIRTERCAEDEEALAIAGESPVSGPDGLFALAVQVRDVGRFFTAGIPDAGLAAIELDARMLAECSLAKVLQLTDSLRGRDNVNVVKVSKNRLAFMQLLVDSEGGVLSNGITSRHERVALLASLSLPNLACVALSVLPDVCAVGGIELSREWQQGL